MIFLIEVCLLLCALLAWWKLMDSHKYSGYPSGPTRLPLVGNLFQVALQFTLYPPRIFHKLAEKYGDVMFIKMGMLDLVFISSHEAASEVLHSDATLDRHMVAVQEDRNMFGNYGIVIASGNVWQTMRRFTIRTLRDFGFGKSASMDDAINEEYDKFEKHLRILIKNGRGTVHIENIFDIPVLNVVWRLVTGKSYELDDSRMNKLLRLSEDFLKSTHVLDISTAYPVLRDWFPKLSGRTLQVSCISKLRNFFKDMIVEQEMLERYNNPECFVDVFLAKIQDGAGKSSEFNYDQLVYVLMDIFQAASDTTSASLSFALLHMIRNPKIQTRVREEINSVVPPDSPVTIAMKQKLPYTHATILETLRRNTILPFSSPRKAGENVILRGNKIKRGTPLILNYEAIHMQKSIWGDPAEFRPERFLTRDEKQIDSKMTDCLVAFSRGKRACLGQSVAEATLLIYFANLMRHFEFQNVPSHKVPPVEPKVGLTNAPQPFNVYVVERI